ncbi:MAG TPA: hypothetical protein PKJ14_01735 [Candidatus Cloacimonadota bacterium]|nr:hypothetical protein [Candidatus Cloacimonadota bacterium]HQL14420.1 hypothetical protein [Candidatus Cloacimonadota bacterium]
MDSFFNSVSIRKIIKQLRLSGSERSLRVKKNAYLSFILMILSNLVSLLFVPVVINCITPVRYGIWLTITSFLSWFTLMDLGIGFGLRVKLSKALATGDTENAKMFVSSAYYSVFFIIILLFLIYLFLRPAINWDRVFNAPMNMRYELDNLMLFVFLFFILRFVFQLINSIYVAYGQTAMATLNNFLGSLLSLVIIYFLSKKINVSLFWIGFIYSITPLIVYLIVSIIFFWKHSSIKPSLHYFKLSTAKSMLNLGVLILAEGFSSIILNSSTNLFIAHLASPADVPPYSITHRLFGLFISVYELATVPLLPAFADAYFKGELKWIRKVIKKMNYITILAIVSVMIGAVFIKPFVHLWLKGKVEVPWSIVILLAIYTIVRLLWNVYIKYLNGIGMIKERIIFVIIGTALYIPLIILLGKFLKLGIVGLLMVQIVISVANVIYFPILYRKSMRKREMELATT